ncbi:unnamed protein product [Allacma fusca]|uniref:Uncharacterized protein n=2 Tax=Allacma fusca TaxID=39272 RepID=A0A8J2JRC2_9HEXA|nr:unnamed protein product [Allacma fusca]
MQLITFTVIAITLMATNIAVGTFEPEQNGKVISQIVSGEDLQRTVRIIQEFKCRAGFVRKSGKCVRISRAYY